MNFESKVIIHLVLLHNFVVNSSLCVKNIRLTLFHQDARVVLRTYCGGASNRIVLRMGQFDLVLRQRLGVGNHVLLSRVN